MKAFSVGWRAIVSLYGDLFFLIGMSLLWWITGGIFVGGAVALGLTLFVAGGPWWVAPVVAIPAGPATVALAAVARLVARGKPHDRLDYTDTLKAEWKRGLALGAVSAGLLALLLLNALFYVFQQNGVLRLLSVLWLYLVIVWLAMQLFVFPFFVALEQPAVFRTYKMAALGALANPLYTLLLLVVALLLTVVSIAIPVLALLVWPALMALLGDHALRVLLVRAGAEQEEPA